MWFAFAPFLAQALARNEKRGLVRLPSSCTTDSIAVHIPLCRVRKVFCYVAAEKASKVHGKVFDSVPESRKVFPSNNTDAFAAHANGLYALNSLNKRIVRQTCSHISAADPGQISLVTGVRAKVDDWFDCGGDMAVHYLRGDWTAGGGRQRVEVSRGCSYYADAADDALDGGNGRRARVPRDAGRASNAWRARKARGRARHARRRANGGRVLMRFYQERKRSWLAWLRGARTLSEPQRRKLLEEVAALKAKIGYRMTGKATVRRARRELRAAQRWLWDCSARPAYADEAVAALAEEDASRHIPDFVRGKAALLRRLTITLNRQAFWKHFASVTRARDAFARA